MGPKNSFWCQKLILWFVQINITRPFIVFQMGSGWKNFYVTISYIRKKLIWDIPSWNDDSSVHVGSAILPYVRVCVCVLPLFSESTWSPDRSNPLSCGHHSDTQNSRYDMLQLSPPPPESSTVWPILSRTGSLIRGPTIISKSPVNQTLSVNQKKLSDPGGGTFR